MPANVVTHAIVLQGSSAVLMARIVKEDGTNILPWEIDNVSCEVWDMETDSLIGEPAISADNFYSANQLNDAWTKDSTGFSFGLSLNRMYLPVGNRIYQVKIRVTPWGDEYTSANSFLFVFRLQTVTVLGE